MNNLMKITFSLFLLIATTSNSRADNEKIKFGKVSMEELAMTTYDKDTSALAVILYDSGSSYFETQFINKSSDFVIKFERHVRIKILKPEDFNYATFKIPLYHSTNGEEKMGNIKVKTYNLDDKIITDKLERSSIFDEETSPNWKQVKFTMPNIKVGSVLEIKYQITTPFFHNFKAWKFQYSIPVVYSEYNTRIPSYFNYQITTKGYYPLTTTNDGYRTENFLIKYTEMDKNSGSAKSIEHQYTLTPVSQVSIYSAENIPAFKSESYMLAEENYMCCIEFELQSYKFDYGAFHNFTSTWENVNEKLITSDEFGLAMKKDGFTKDILSEIIKEEKTEEERTALLFQAVQNNVKWDGKYRLFCDKSLKNTWKDKAGSTAEINHVKYLMDATAPYCPIGILPFHCLNDKGRLITENGSEWINLDPYTDQKFP